MLDGQVQPRIKNKFCNATCSDNDRKVIFLSNMLKIFGYLMLPPILKACCDLNPCQFGHREKTSTTDVVTLIKEITKKYTKEGSTVYTQRDRTMYL